MRQFLRNRREALGRERLLPAVHLGGLEREVEDLVDRQHRVKGHRASDLLGYVIEMMLDGMQRRGLLVRSRDPDDRRRHLVELTPSGVRLLVTARRVAATAEEELLAPLAPAERDQLRSWLIQIAAHPGGPTWRC